MTALDAPAAVDFRRDQWGRPLIRVGDALVPYTRSSSAAKVIEDTYNLELWARRNVAYGMARDASLVARVLAVGGDPVRWDTSERKQVNKICADAVVIAQAHRGADIGTAVHRMTELVDRGHPLEAGPYEADIAAYRAALAAAGLTVDVERIECRLVCDELQTAGTADRMLVRSDGLRVIGDIKTGATVDYGALGWAAQLASYAHSELYDVDTDQRLATPALDRTMGIVIHLPAGQGTCTLYELDLVAGYRAAELANEIRAVRREAKRWICPLSIWTPEPADDRRALLLARHGALTDEQRARYNHARVPKGDLDAVEAALDEIEREGPTVDDATYEATKARYEALDATDRGVIAKVVRQARDSGASISVSVLRSERRVAIADALIEWCRVGWDPEIVRDLLAVVLGDNAAAHPSMPLGVAVAALTTTEAKRLGDMARAVTAGAALKHGDGRWLVAVP